MKKNQKRLLAFAVMMAIAPAYAASLSEVEENSPINSSQYLTITDKVTEINAAVGVPSATSTSTIMPAPGVIPTAPLLAPAPTSEPDLDYYSFYANAGDVVTLDIDGGIGGVQSVDTIVAVFDESYKVLRQNDDAPSLDAGSTSTLDSRIDNFKITKSGIYYVGVSAYPRFFVDGGGVTSSGAGKGDYKLVISGVTPAVHQITLDVKPGSSDRAPINPKSNGKVPVALLSDNSFNAMDIDPATVTFGSNGNEPSLSKCNPAGLDVNGDGLLDLICHFDNQKANFHYDSLEGIARGKTRKGVAFEGHGLLKVTPTLTK